MDCLEALHDVNLFQFTPLREGRRPQVSLRLRDFGFQFTPLREGRLYEEAQTGRFKGISIHAPA